MDAPKIEYYITADLCEAAILLMRPQCILCQCEWESEADRVGRWVILIRPNSGFSLAELRQIIEDLKTGDYLVEPRAFMSALRKARVAMQEFLQSKNVEPPTPRQVRNVVNPKSREKNNASSSTV